MTKPKTRVQLDLTTDEAAALDRLRNQCSLRSRADAVRTALAVLEWVEHEASSGRRIVAVNSESLSYLTVGGITKPKNGSRRRGKIA